MVAERVAAQCAETAQVAVLDGTNVVYVAKVDGTHPVRLVSSGGRRLPAHCTAVGKTLLSAPARGRVRRPLPARCRPARDDVAQHHRR